MNATQILDSIRDIVLKMPFWKKGRTPFNYHPRIAKSVYATLNELKVEKEAEVEVRTKQAVPIFTVASVELGNTTTKCIITSTNLKKGCVYLLNKTVKFTAQARPPKLGESTFGRTIWGKELSRQSVKEFIRDILLESLRKSSIQKDEDLHFVVRSTGVTASFTKPEETGTMIKALAEGCIGAGISPSKMVAPPSKDFVPAQFRPYSKLDKVPFRGAIAGCFPPRVAGEIMANEMEAELSTAGIKIGAKWTDVDFRNPVLSLDFGTTFKGRIIDGEVPYAQTLGSVCGLSGAIIDALVQGTGEASNALEFKRESQSKPDLKTAENLAHEAHKYVNIERVSAAADRYGTVPVNPKAAEESGILLIGCDAGQNGSNFQSLRRLGAEIKNNYGLNQIYLILDYVSALIFLRVVEISLKEGILSQKTSIGITGRAGITGNKPHLMLEYLDQLDFYRNDKTEKRVVFVEDGLALGANAAARCMFSLGTPDSPLGGSQGMKCVLVSRIEYERQKHPKKA